MLGRVARRSRTEAVGARPELPGEIEQVGGTRLFDREEDLVKGLGQGREPDDREGQPDHVADGDPDAERHRALWPRPRTRATMAAMPVPARRRR